MPQTYNLYCDESCHLEHDQQSAMVLGAVWCPLELSRTIALDISAIKRRHGIAASTEVKWVKVSPAKVGFYLDLINYFFDRPELHFRALVIPDKSKLRHNAFGQDHDLWYYKMYFSMIKAVLSPDDVYRIYLDIKDTRSADKVAKLQDVLCNNLYDFSRNIVERVQTVRSHEVALLQLCDVLIGAVSYVNRGLATSPAKAGLVRRIQERSGYSLVKTTLLRETKFNVFVWRASEPEA
ncbi:MAG TPA: DUF3800 domain-containing protein [Bryobacteraceae bacterium]|nr:DUF3800 domain-containing protein [Bryobacteraceae bacterium]